MWSRWPRIVRCYAYWAMGAWAFGMVLWTIDIYGPSVPLWWIWGPSGVVIVLAVSKYFRLRKRVMAADYRICPDCGYALAGHNGAVRCPECGVLLDVDGVRQRWLAWYGHMD